MKTGKGQAMVMLVLLTVILASIATSVVAIVTTNALNTMREERGNQALSIAESGAEEALLQLLRDPSYSGGSLTTSEGSATVVVVGDGTKTITSQGEVVGYVKVVEVVARMELGQLLIDSWQEI